MAGDGKVFVLERVELPQCWAWVGVPCSASSCLMAFREGGLKKKAGATLRGQSPACLLF